MFESLDIEKNVEGLIDLALVLIKKHYELQKKCFFDIETFAPVVSPLDSMMACLEYVKGEGEGFAELWRASWTYVSKESNNYYFRGKAFFFIITIFIPASSSIKITKFAEYYKRGLNSLKDIAEKIKGLSLKEAAKVLKGKVQGAGNWASKLKNKNLLSVLEADINANPAFKNLLEADNNILDAWEILSGTPYRTGEKYLNYVSKLSKDAKLGNATSFDYRTNFFNEFPELTRTDYVVHHAIEQQVLKDYPNIFLEAELHSLENLRGIPKTINSDIHLSKIRVEWNKFYKLYPNATKQQFLEKAKEIDDLFGNQFYPPIR